MKKSVKKNYIYNLAYQILLIIMPIVTTPYLSRTLGSEGIGIYGYTISIVTYFILFGTLGISTYAQREIAYYQDDKEKISKIFWQLIVIRLISMLLVTIVYYITFGIAGEYSLYYRILMIELFSNMIDITWLFQGMENFQKIVIRNFIIKIISICSIFLFVKSSSDVDKYLLIYTLTNLIGNLSLWFNIHKYIYFTKIDLKSTVKHIWPIITLFIPQIAIQVYTVLDKTMIGLILKDMNEVGYYEQAQKIVKLVLTLITALGTVMVPRIANLHKKGNKKQIFKYMEKAFNFIWFLATPLLFGIIAISSNFVPWFFGEGFEKVSMLIVITSPIFYAIGFNNLIGIQYLIPTGKQNVFTISVVIGAVVNFSLNLILINLIGVKGACISTVIAETTILIYQLYYIKKKDNFDISCLFKYSFKYIISGIIMLIITYSIGTLLKPAMSTTIIQVGIGMIVYIGMLFILKDKFFLSYFNLYKNKIMKKVVK